jgi:hypothetical protein
MNSETVAWCEDSEYPDRKTRAGTIELLGGNSWSSRSLGGSPRRRSLRWSRRTAVQGRLGPVDRRYGQGHEPDVRADRAFDLIRRPSSLGLSCLSCALWKGQWRLPAYGF